MPAMRQSAGLLLFRRREGKLEVFLIHPGGPFWQRKDAGAWSIPKGEFSNEPPLQAALREFVEETGLTSPTGQFIELTPVKQPGGKTVFAWAVEWDCDATQIKSNTFTLEWPKGSGVREFPEIDRAGWFDIATATSKLLKGQLPLLNRLVSVAPPEPNSD